MLEKILQINFSNPHCLRQCRYPHTPLYDKRRRSRRFPSQQPSAVPDGEPTVTRGSGLAEEDCLKEDFRMRDACRKYSLEYFRIAPAAVLSVQCIGQFNRSNLFISTILEFKAIGINLPAQRRPDEYQSSHQRGLIREVLKLRSVAATPSGVGNLISELLIMIIRLHPLMKKGLQF